MPSKHAIKDDPERERKHFTCESRFKAVRLLELGKNSLQNWRWNWACDPAGFTK